MEVRDYTALLSGYDYREGYGDGVGAFISFSFPQTLPDYYALLYDADALATFRPLTEAERDAARAALDAWATVSGVTFFEVAPDEGSIKFSAFTFSDALGGDAQAFAFLPAGGTVFDQDVFLDSAWAGDMAVLLHEIGHALGLKHPFEGDVTLAPDLDNTDETVMSYTVGPGGGDELGPLDISAIQSLYGDAAADGLQVAEWHWDAAAQTLYQTGPGRDSLLFGIGGSDVIHGGDGADQIWGRGGRDQLFGEGGDDIIFALDEQSLIDGGAGNDGLSGSDGDDHIIGGDGIDALSGRLGDDFLEGGAGNDTLNSGTGRDRMYGGDGDDFMAVDLTGEPDGLVVDGGNGFDSAEFTFYPEIDRLVLSRESLEAAGASISGLEHLSLVSNANGLAILAADDIDTWLTARGDGTSALIGGDGEDGLAGGTGNDVFWGGGGVDSFMGDAGDDVLIGGSGADTLTGAYGADRFVYASAAESTAAARDWITDFQSGTDILDLSALGIETVTIGTVLGDTEIAAGDLSIRITGTITLDDIMLEAPPPPAGTSGADTLAAPATGGTLRGAAGDDLLVGSALRDTLDGGSGADMMAGLGGDDTYVVNSADDIVFERAGEGTDTVRAAIDLASLGPNVENVALLGTATAAAGNALDNRMQGNDAANRLSGGAGADVLIGGAGDDRLDGGSGIDEAAFADARAACDIRIDGAAVVIATATEGVDRIEGVENFVFAGRSYSLAALIEGAEQQFLIGAGNGAAIDVSGTGSVIGSVALQDVTVLDRAGTITFDPSFNSGGDRIRLSGDAADWTAWRAGSTLMLSDGDTIVELPAGAAITDLVFDDGVRGVSADVAANRILVAGRAMGADPAALDVAAEAPHNLAPADPDAVSRVVLAPGAEVTLGGNLFVFGTAGPEAIALTSGSRAAFDPSFNSGGDLIDLGEAAARFVAARLGSTIEIASEDLSVSVPVGTSPMTIRFADGDRALYYDTADRSVHLGDAIIGAGPVPLGDAALSGGDPGLALAA